MDTTLVQIQDLQVVFELQQGPLKALCGITFDICAGEIFGLVGESGCGKSMTGLSMLRLVPAPGKITAGEILFQGEDLVTKSETEMRRIRWESIATIFQDPTTSLNPVFQIGTQLVHVLRQHHKITKKAAREQVLRSLDSVGLPDIERIFGSYPHQLSGGMQQRVMIAMALVCRPTLLIADEPTTALDVTIQAQILKLLRELRDSMGITIMMITHDLGVIAELCDRVAVLYAGRVVEISPTEALFDNPHHPYTQGLIAAIPQPGRRGEPLTAIPGTVPSNPGAVRGCPFASRCPHTFDRCRTESPPLYALTGDHSSACYLSEKGESIEKV